VESIDCYGLAFPLPNTQLGISGDLVFFLNYVKNRYLSPLLARKN